MAFDIACRNGSQFFFWFTEASVGITPKLISAGVCAPAARADAPIVRAAAAHVKKARIMRCSPMVTSVGAGKGSPMLSRAQALGRFVLAPMPRRSRPIETRRKKLAALRAVDVAQQRWRELVAGSVVNDLARFQRDRARAVGQRV